MKRAMASSRAMMTRRRDAAAMMAVMARLRRGPGGMRTPRHEIMSPAAVSATDSHSLTISVSHPSAVSITPITTSRRRRSMAFFLGCIASVCRSMDVSACSSWVILTCVSRSSSSSVFWVVVSISVMRSGRRVL